MKMETYFKFENGMITKLKSSTEVHTKSPNCIVLSKKTLDNINVSDDLKWI